MTNTITAAAVALVVLLISVYWRRMAAKQIKDDTKNQAGIKLTESELLAKRRKARRIPSFLMWLAVIILIVIGVYSVWSFFSTRAPKPATGTEASSEAGTTEPETEPTSEPESETAPEEETPAETADNSEEEVQSDTEEPETAEEQIVSEDTALAAVKTMATFSERLGEVLSSPAATQPTTGVLEQTTEEQSEATATPTATPEATAQPTATPQAEAQGVKATLDLSEVNAGLSKLASLCAIADERVEIDGIGVIKMDPYFLQREYQSYRMRTKLHADWRELDYLQEHMAEYLFGTSSIDMLMYPNFVDWDWIEQAAGTQKVTYDDLKGVDLDDHDKVLALLDKRLPEWEKEWDALPAEEQIRIMNEKAKLAICNCPAMAEAWYLAFCDSEGIYQAYSSELDDIGRRFDEAFDLEGKDRTKDKVGREVWLTRLEGVEIFDPEHEEYSATYNDEYFINIAAPLCSFFDGLTDVGIQKPRSYSHWSLPRLGKNSALRRVAHLEYLDDYYALIKTCPAKSGGIAYKYGMNAADFRPEKFPVTKYERSTPPPKEKEQEKEQEKQQTTETVTTTTTTTTTSENPGSTPTPNPTPNPTPTPTPKDGEGAKKSEVDPVNQGNANVDGGNQEPGSDKEQDNSKEIENNKNYTPAETAKPTTSSDSSSNSSSNDTVHEGNTEVSKPITETGSSGTATSTTTTENSDGSTTVTEVKKDINSERNDAANENFQGF